MVLIILFVWGLLFILVDWRRYVVGLCSFWVVGLGLVLCCFEIGIYAVWMFLIVLLECCFLVVCFGLMIHYLTYMFGFWVVLLVLLFCLILWVLLVWVIGFVVLPGFGFWVLIDCLLTIGLMMLGWVV